MFHLYVYDLAFNELLIVLDLGSPWGWLHVLVRILIDVDSDLVSV